MLVIGGGPAGAAAGYWLAEAGHDVLIVEKKHFPREKTCGDGLTPRAVRQLQDMGLEHRLEDFHRYDGLRAVAHGVTLELKWPDHPRFPPYGYVVRRRDLDEFVAERAVKSGAVLRQGIEAIRRYWDLNVRVLQRDIAFEFDLLAVRGRKAFVRGACPPRCRSPAAPPSGSPPPR